MEQIQKATPQEFNEAWMALPDAFRSAHQPPQERDEILIARWFNELHKATEQACVAGLALATEHVSAHELDAAADVLKDVRPFGQVMRLVDRLGKRSA